MKLKWLFLLPILPLMSSCDDGNVVVTSAIVNKSDRSSMIVTYAGTVICIPVHYYYFEFGERKPYTKKVTREDYDKFEVGDMFTFFINESEKEYFYFEVEK